MLILGGPGTGKSALSGWILDELEDQKQQADGEIVLQFFISNEKYKSTCFDLVRGLLLQLLGIKLGHPALHQCLTTTYDNAVQSHASRDLESSLWDDFENVVATLDNVVLVIDGLDELDSKTLAMVTRLSNLATAARAGSGTFKIIITSRPMQTEPPANVEKFRIEPEITRSDVSTYISHCIQQLSGTERSPFYRMEDVDRNTNIGSMG
ncbi:hypothetical protein ABVK25_008645 [Lepraria finkii]|uniref:NACHT domain-containing protein n=1 Tax=Lepraria finkii TaxID=1340010 RepID=A0ABR4B224_9LECA